MGQNTSIADLTVRAEFGDQRAQRLLGLSFYYGRGGAKQNYEEAARWFAAAHDKEYLGECYLHGYGVERNVEKAITLWEESCDEHLRNYDVMLKLAHLYGDGIEMAPDYKKALHLWYALAENDEGIFGEGFSEAFYQLACYYAEGKGVEKNLSLARKYFRHAITLFGEEKLPGTTEEPAYIIHTRDILAKGTLTVR